MSEEANTLEPWLRGLRRHPDPVTAHLLRAAEQIREDARRALSELTPGQIWARPLGVTSAGFHAKHLAGSTRRLCAYLEGRQLTDGELAESAGEAEGTEDGAVLTAAIDRALEHYAALVTGLATGEFGSVREVGRRRIQTTAVSLAIHIAEHGQRHTGQLVSAARLTVAASRHD